MCCLGDEAEPGAATEGITLKQLGAIFLMFVKCVALEMRLSLELLQKAFFKNSLVPAVCQSN
jgi:hypothetical protein